MKERLDVLLFKRGIVDSRERAKALIMEGKVLVNARAVTKAGASIDADARIEMKGEDMPYVSRGGLKLDAAIEHFAIKLRDVIAIDVGSSTGGFTDCMLQRGAKRVYCVDVGYGQLSWPLRNDPRIILFERTNIRYLEKEKIPEDIDFATVDLSFISLKKVLAKVMEFLRHEGEILALVKPQFEVGKGEIGKGGIVRDERQRMAAVDGIAGYAEEIGLKAKGIFRSPVLGQKGNQEYFCYLRNP
ncbi:MAG TPA: TlyA family rRNA (cytidine-2'-O)-methyltransferase [Nitrospiraceae bacterium]|nr:TlyA family rRNA (cytidine-2'-O)-methyltransferase [Nitrospiraceae bacterium]